MSSSTGNKSYQIPKWRIILMFAALLSLALVLCGRIALLQVWPNYERGFVFLQAQGEARANRTINIPAPRGMILDREGRPLAVSTPVLSVWADPALMELSDTEIAGLASELGIPEEVLSLKLKDQSGRRFVYIKRGMVPSVREGLLPYIGRGVYLMEEYRRFYPSGEVSSQVVGFTNIDEQGQEGVELSLDSLLRGTSGSQLVVRDRQGRVVESAVVIEPASPGDNVTLTLDSRLQYLAYRELKSAVTAHGATAGSLVTMDVDSGEILAMVNQPAFNPNNRADIQPASVRNRVLTDLFEPGSTIKAFTMLAALESGRYRPETIVDTSPGRMQVDGKLIYDAVNYGELSLAMILAKSSQVGTSKIALDLDPDQLPTLLRRVGFGEIPGIGFPGEVAGSVPQRYEWEPIERTTLAYGYGLAVSPIQLASAYAVLGNGGFRVTPSLYRDATAVAPEQVADSGLTDDVLQMLRGVVEIGTGKLAATSSYDVAGKTGTMHFYGESGYEANKYSAVFAGLAPAEDPRIVTVVVIHDPKTDDYGGGSVAAPVFSATTEATLRILGEMPSAALSTNISAAALPLGAVQ
jgi:cell division protein FtsI (penicillin-binding protein 3)